jgi:hypothetical protein
MRLETALVADIDCQQQLKFFLVYQNEKLSAIQLGYRFQFENTSLLQASESS